MFIAGDALSLILIVALFYLRWPKSTHFGAKHRPELRTLGPAIAAARLLGAQLRPFLRSWPALALVDESSKRGKVREVAGLRPYTSYALYSGHLICRVMKKRGGYPLPGTPGTEPRLRRVPVIHSPLLNHHPTPSIGLESGPFPTRNARFAFLMLSRSRARSFHRERAFCPAAGAAAAVPTSWTHLPSVEHGRPAWLVEARRSVDAWSPASLASGPARTPCGWRR